MSFELLANEEYTIGTHFIVAVVALDAKFSSVFCKIPYNLSLSFEYEDLIPDLLHFLLSRFRIVI